MRRPHLARSCSSSPHNSLSNKVVIDVIQLPPLWSSSPSFPRHLHPINLFPMYSYSLLNTCPYHFSLLSCTFVDISPTFVVPLILSFLILTSLVTPLIRLNILISATFNFQVLADFCIFSNISAFLRDLHVSTLIKMVLVSHRL